MQAPTHVIAGSVIQRSLENIKPPWLRNFLIAVIGLFMHSVFDRVARLTYHPAEPDFKSAFWVGYHLVVLTGFLLSLRYFWKPCKLGIIFSILPDFDWVVKHACNALGINSGFWKTGMIHESIHWFADRIPPFSLLKQLPDLTHQPTGILPEAFLILGMLLLLLKRKKPGDN